MSKDIITINEIPKLIIVKAPTGLGKSHAYIDYALGDYKCSKVIVAPTNDLKDQIFNDCITKENDNTDKRIFAQSYSRSTRYFVIR